jgi:hypothetical protein
MRTALDSRNGFGPADGDDNQPGVQAINQAQASSTSVRHVYLHDYCIHTLFKEGKKNRVSSCVNWIDWTLPPASLM